MRTLRTDVARLADHVIWLKTFSLHKNVLTSTRKNK